MTNAGQQSYTEEIPMLVVIFVAVTITVLVLVTMLIIANTMKRRIIAKTDFQSQEPGMQIKNYQVRILETESAVTSAFPDLAQTSMSSPQIFPVPNCLRVWVVRPKAWDSKYIVIV